MGRCKDVGSLLRAESCKYLLAGWWVMDIMEKRMVVAGARPLAYTSPQNCKPSFQTGDDASSKWCALSSNIQMGS